MMKKRKFPAVDAAGKSDKKSVKSTLQDYNKPPTKTKSVLGHLVSGGTLNYREAYLRLHDSCLHTTVSTLQNQYGVRITREFETVRGYRDSRIRCRRYWIAPEDRRHAQNVLERLR